MPRRLDIQGLRALAIALVVVFHSGLALPGGFVGVDVFFAISGFVITSTLVAELERTGTISLPRFYLRRVKRLLPALAVLVTFVAVVGLLAAPAAASHLSALTGVFASFFAANIYLYTLPSGYFSVSTQLDPLLHTWTLAVEEQFYLVFPALLLGAWWLGARRGRGRAAALIAVAVVADASFMFATHPGNAAGVGIGYYGSPARAWEFAAGCLVALGVPLWRRVSAWLAALLVAAGSAGIVAVAVVGGAQSSFLVAPLIPVASACALLVAGCVANRLSRFFELRPVTWLGDLSYSLYLWHWPLIVFASALLPGRRWAGPAAAAIALLPAWASYRYVENPIRRAPRVHGRVAIALAATCILVPAMVSFGVSRVPRLDRQTYVAGYHADLVRGCEDWTPYGSKARDRCVWRAPDARGTAVLIGDSNAGHFTEPFVAAANAAGYTAVVAAPSGCPFVQLTVSNAGQDYTACNRFVEQALPALVRQRPSLVVISARTDAYLDRPSFVLTAPDGTVARDPAAKARLWGPALGTEIATLNRAGIPVVVVHPVPTMPHSVADCAVVLLLVDRCGGGTSRTTADARLRPSLDAEQAAIAGRPAAWLVGFEDELCSRARCSSRRNGLILYRDLDHLSVAGSETLAGSFARRVIVHARGWQPPSRSVASAGPCSSPCRTTSRTG